MTPALKHYFIVFFYQLRVGNILPDAIPAREHDFIVFYQLKVSWEYFARCYIFSGLKLRQISQLIHHRSVNKRTQSKIIEKLL